MGSSSSDRRLDENIVDFCELVVMVVVVVMAFRPLKSFQSEEIRSWIYGDSARWQTGKRSQVT